MRRLAAPSLLLALACGGGSPPEQSADEVRAAIEAQNRAFGEAVRAGNPVAIGALYTEDGAVLPPNAAKMSGRAAAAEFWAGALAGGVAAAVLTTEEVTYGGGDTATEVGSAALSAKDGSALDEAKYIVLWKREGDSWRLHRDIWNSNRPPMPAAPPESPPTPADPANPRTADAP